MASTGSGGQRARGLAAARLQPENQVAIEQPDTAALRDEAARIDRLAGDRDLIDRLRRRDFTGAEYDRTAEELVRYGVAVLKSWILAGTIYEKCAYKGRPVKRADFEAFDDAEAESMAGEVITVAIARFRTEVLLPGLWDPSRGASLTTYFVGQCILCFPGVYRPWRTQQPPKRNWALNRLDENLSTEQAVEDDVIRERTTVDALRLVKSQEARTALVMVGMGYRQAYIAEHLGMTEKAVERMIHYAKQQVRKGRESA